MENRMVILSSPLHARKASRLALLLASALFVLLAGLGINAVSTEDAWADTVGTIGGATATVDGSGNCVISGDSISSAEWVDIDKTTVTTIRFEPATPNSSISVPTDTSLASLFYGCSLLMSVDFENFDTTGMKSTSGMFRDCPALELVDFGSTFNTSAVTTMSYMFQGCTSLETIDLSGFDTSKVSLFTNMFYNCSSLKTVDMSSFNTANVTRFQSMFTFCTSLESVSVGAEFYGTKTQYMNQMFMGCSSLRSFDFGDVFTTPVLKSAPQMFYNCPSLTSVDFGASWNTSSATSLGNTFDNCSNLNTVTFGTSFTCKGSCSFESDYITLPTPPSDTTTGLWIKGGSSKTPVEIRNLTNADRAGTWTWAVKSGSYVTNIDLNGGISTSAVSSMHASSSSATVTVPTAVARDGYALAGWTYHVAGQADQSISTSTFNATTGVVGTLSAQWSQPAQLIFKNGSNTMYTQTLASSGATELAPLSSMNTSTCPSSDYGWEFYGWAETASSITCPYGYTENHDEITASADVTLHAVYFRTVTLNYYDASTNQTISANRDQFWYGGEEHALTSALPTLTASASYGWTPYAWVASGSTAPASSSVPTSASATGVYQLAATPSVDAEDSPYLYALYSRTPSLSYDENGATVVSAISQAAGSTQYMATGSDATTSSVTLASPDGHYTAPSSLMFGGWDTNASASTGAYAAGATFSFGIGWASNESETCYAIWRTPAVLIYASNGTTGIAFGNDYKMDGLVDSATASYTFGTPSIVLPQGNDAKEFAYYSTNANGAGTVYKSGDTITNISADTIMYAMYVEPTDGEQYAIVDAAGNGQAIFFRSFFTLSGTETDPRDIYGDIVVTGQHTVYSDSDMDESGE
ncbi:MAG: hypothetical protein BZ138_06460, partial [Methanosphaera sp. rholeuAM270]